MPSQARFQQVVGARGSAVVAAAGLTLHLHQLRTRTAVRCGTMGAGLLGRAEGTPLALEAKRLTLRVDDHLIECGDFAVYAGGLRRRRSDAVGTPHVAYCGTAPALTGSTFRLHAVYRFPLATRHQSCADHVTSPTMPRHPESTKARIPASRSRVAESREPHRMTGHVSRRIGSARRLGPRHPPAGCPRCCTNDSHASTGLLMSPWC